MRNFWDNPALLLVLVLIIVLIFGAKRLPDAARSLGRSMKIFKSEVKDLRDDEPDADRRQGTAAPLEGRVVDDQRVQGYGGQAGPGGDASGLQGDHAPAEDRARPDDRRTGA